MNRISVKDLVANGYMTAPAFLDSKFILLTPETPISPTLIRNLLEWDYREVLSDGDVQESQVAQAGQAEEQEAQGLVANAVEDAQKLSKVQDFYKKFTSYVEDLFSNYVTKNELNVQIVSNRVKELYDMVKDHRSYILRFQEHIPANRNYLVSHSVRSTVLAITLGSYLKLAPHRLIELGVACLLHEIGMVRLPPQLYMNERPLNPQEKKHIITHPILGYNILRSFSFPLNICLAALEHHERTNGSGYPRQLSADKISLYAKIIMVACSYEAVTAKRPYKEAKDGYAGMLDLLKNTGKQYDETVIKALVYSLSIYPIGLYVLLSNGKPGQVVDVNPDNPRFPVVSVREIGQEADSLIATSEGGIKILRPLNDAEKAAL
jgi:HD-GYP domain-containing protein (c-di-GMP phosphodiesterase class II)